MKRLRDIENGDIVRHFKGGTYEVLETEARTSGGKKVVVYKRCEDSKIFVIDYDEFMGIVSPENYPELTEIEFRFIVVRKFNERISADYESLYKHLEEVCAKLQNEKEELKQCIKNLASSIDVLMR